MKAEARRGFTLVELLVVVTLGGFLVLAIYQTLIANSRTYGTVNAQILGQQSLRAGLDVLFGELREISTRGGDLVVSEEHSLTVRTQRAFGVVCATDYSRNPPEVTAFRVGPAIQAHDSVFILADNEPDRAGDDVWLNRWVQTADSTASCAGSPGQRLGIKNLGASGDTVRVGAPVRAYRIYTYSLVELEGEHFLGRRLAGDSRTDPMVGPLLPGEGLVFRYLDSLGAVTTVDTLVAQIEVVLRYQSAMRDAGNHLVSDSILARIYPRN